MISSILNNKNVNFTKVQNIVRKNIQNAIKAINGKTVEQLTKTVTAVVGGQNPKEIKQNLKQTQHDLFINEHNIDLSLNKKIRNLLDSYKTLVQKAKGKKGKKLLFINQLPQRKIMN